MKPLIITIFLFFSFKVGYTQNYVVLDLQKFSSDEHDGSYYIFLKDLKKSKRVYIVLSLDWKLKTKPEAININDTISLILEKRGRKEFFKLKRVPVNEAKELCELDDYIIKYKDYSLYCNYYTLELNGRFWKEE